MRKIIKAVLFSTKWGSAVDFEGELAFLEIPAPLSWQDYEFGVELEFEVFYTLMFSREIEKCKINKKPEGANKGWEIISADTLEELSEHPDFKEYNLTSAKARPNVTTKPKPKF